MEPENKNQNQGAPKAEKQTSNPNNNQGSKDGLNNSNKPRYNKRNFNGRPGYQRGYGNRQDKNLSKDSDKIVKDAQQAEHNFENGPKKNKNDNRDVKIINNSQENTHEQKNNQPRQKNENFKNNRKEKKNFVKPEETADDIRKDTKRIEKEIELEIKEIGALKLGL